MKPHESPRIRKKSIRGDSGDSRPVWNRGITWASNLCNANLERKSVTIFLYIGLSVCVGCSNELVSLEYPQHMF